MSPASRRSSAHQPPPQQQPHQQQQAADHFSSSVNLAHPSQHRGHPMHPSNQLPGLVHRLHRSSSSIPPHRPPSAADDSSPSPVGSPTPSSLPHPNANDNLHHLHPHPPSLPPGHLKQVQQQNRRSTHSHNSSLGHHHINSDIHHSSRTHTHSHSHHTLPPSSNDPKASKFLLQTRQGRRQNEMDASGNSHRLSTHTVTLPLKHSTLTSNFLVNHHHH